VALKKAVELDSGNLAAAINLSSIYIAERDFQKALVPLEMVVRKGTKDYRLLNNYGVALAGTGKFSQAKGQYQAALSVNSSAKDVMLNLAILQIDHLKNYQEGMDLLSKLKFLGPPEGTRSRISDLENKARAGSK
jgi:Flp pilus assembly protein TadD